MIVWLASYPRSGNTFLRVLVSQCIGLDTYSVYGEEKDLAPDAKSKELVGADILPKDQSLNDLRSHRRIYLIKTHGRFEGHMSDDRIIYLIRDGREATESYFHYLAQFGQTAYSRDEIIAGTRFISGWGEHVENWTNRQGVNQKIIRFEDLITRPHEIISEVAAFLGRQLIENKIPTFDELKEQNPRFFRSGKTNSWEQEWSADERKYFWFKNGEIMIKNGYMPDDDYHNLNFADFYNREISALRLTLLSEIKTRADRLENLLKTNKNDLQNVKKTIDTVASENIRLNKKVQELQLQNENKRIRLARVTNSTSYRLGLCITWPLRLVKKMLR